MSTSACQKEQFFLKKDLLLAASYRKTPVLEYVFSSENCEIFKSTFFGDYLRTAASKNVFMKLRKSKIYREL